ncbi:MAG: TonB-dependent receptor [Vicinamibacterales bacterium]
MSFRLKACRAVFAVLLLAGLILPALASAQGTVRVVGQVRDEFNAITLPGVPVEVVGGQTVYTDVDGRYTLDLAPGSYEVKVSLDGYQERTIRLTVPAGGRTITADIGIAMAKFAETVTVTAEAAQAQFATTEATLTERKRSSAITDNLGAQEMKENADSDAAAAMQRVTGLSVVDNSYVFVRGLGERYSNTTLNGAVIPTTEPDKKVVPLDLFPSGLLSSVSVAKSYTPDRSAEFAGGLVEVVPLKFPTQTVFDLSYSLGFNTLTTGKDVPSYAGGGGDWYGFDDGTRDLPSAVPDRKVIRGGIYTPSVGVLRSDLERIGKAFSDTWNVGTASAKPNQSGGLTFGSRFGKLGILGSYTQSYKTQFNTENQVYYRATEGGLSEFSNYDFRKASTKATIGGVGNVSLQFTPSQRITWENFYTHAGNDEARTFEGFNSDVNTDIRNQRLFWVEEELISSGLTGEHFFSNLANSRIDWRATVSNASRDEPDLREVLYERNGNAFVLADESQSGFRMFNTLADDTTDVAANWSVFSTMNELPVQFKFGGQYVERTRDFTSRRFRFVPVSTSGLDLTADAETLFRTGNIGPKFEIKEETRVTDTYAASQKTTSFYAMTDLALSTRLRLVGGARIEKFDQQVDTFDLFDFEGDPDVITAKLENTDVFPAVNLVFSPQPDRNIRVGFSQTVNRPEFRELAPFEFTDVVGGRATVGNPDLTRALIQNFDLRYEIFPGAEEVLAASFFYKNFQDPIERVVEFTAQLRTSFANAESARNLGFELEARKKLGENVLVGANYTFVDSSVTLSDTVGQAQTSLERALAGQSKNLLNLLGEVRFGSGSFRVLYNFADKRISDVGTVGLPDIYEDGRGTLDMVLGYRVNRLNFKFSADNLTNEAYEFTQGDRLQRSFSLGRTFAFNVGFSAF